MASASASSITFYDISSNEPMRTFAPNPWKTRFALNYKGVPYQTEWVQMPKITEVREKLGVPANRTLPDGTPYHTLPVIHDHNTGALVGDSFEIALYLDSAYPDAPSLFRKDTIGLTAAFNANIDTIFTKYTALCSAMPMDPRCADEAMQMFAKRGEMMAKKGKASEQMERGTQMAEFEAKLGELRKAYYHTGGTTDHYWNATGTDKAQKQRPPTSRKENSVFLDGDSPAYADFIVGAWLKMMEESLPKEDWQRIRSWQDGFWGDLADGLQKWTEIK